MKIARPVLVAFTSSLVSGMWFFSCVRQRQDDITQSQEDRPAQMMGQMGRRQGGMMGGDMMRNTREMMQRMMGDVLPPGIDPALLPDPNSKGAEVLKTKCVQCHNLPGPGMHTAQEWPAVVARMQKRMQMMNGMKMWSASPLSPAELTSLLDYLQRHALKPVNKAEALELKSLGGRAFSATCGQCHALPDPKQHTAAEWPQVVKRMQKDMAAMGKSVPDEATTQAIIRFLEGAPLASP